MPPQPPKQPADGPISGDIDRISAHRRQDAADGPIAALAADQHGLVSLEQLISFGLTETAIHQRAGAGRLQRVQQGVYAAGHVPQTREARYMAAVLACGPEAVLSHRSAADLWKLRDAKRSRIDVTAPGRRGRAPAGIDAHREGSLAAADRTTVYGIPCTSVARTLLDFAGVEPVWELRRAVGEAEVRRILNKGAVRNLIKRSRGRRAVARLRMIIDEIHPETKRTYSYMERLFLRMCTHAELPRPEVNVTLRVGNQSFKPDFLWREAGLIIEADSRRFHDTDMAFLDDRRREQRLQLVGWRISHCTWWEIEHEPRRLAETVRGLLAQAAKPLPMGRFPVI